MNTQINAEDFGLNKDGAGAANRQALLAAIAAGAATGLPVSIPAGKFVIAPGIHFSENVAIRGAGDSTTLNFSGSGDPIPAFTYPVNSNLRVKIENLDITGAVHGAMRYLY